MKYLLVITVLFLSGCGSIDREKAKLFGRGYEVCVEGVVYLQFASGVSVAYNQDGTIKKCDKY